MERVKAWIITAAIVLLFGTVVWLLWANSIRSYWVVCQIVALYGFIRGAFDVGNWVASPVPQKSTPKHKTGKKFEKGAETI